MNTTTQQYAKKALLSSTLFLPALAAALWAGRLAGTQSFLAVLLAIGLALGAFCFLRRHDDLVHDFFLPILLFAALGAMTWAVRGSSGFGAVKGCVFAGVMWGAAWWFIARNPAGPPARRYSSGWIVLALTIGIGLSGGRGWMQWSAFFDGMLQTNAAKNEFVEISPTYGLIWLFIAGVPWAGIGACLLAWCAAERPLAAWQWSVRLFCGFGGAFFAMWLYKTYPQWFLPLYSTLSDRYADVEANPNLKRLMNDNGAAMRHMGFFLGFLLYEVGRRDWKNVTLIATVGFVNGFGWALCQNWKWSDNVWPTAQFNFWRAWESSGGISIGIALGIAYYLVNRRTEPCNCTSAPARTGFPVFGVCCMIFMSVLLLWYVVANAGGLFSADWAAHLPFCAVLLYGLGLYFWHLRTTLLGKAESSEPAIPRLGPWAVRFGLMALVAWFMMGPLEFFREPDPATPMWARFDYLFVGATGLYGVLYFLTALWKSVTVRPEERESLAPFFQRYPNLDWLAVYVSLTIIACSFLRGEIPAWKGWLWVAQEAPPAWIGSLGLACLVLFGVIWCALSYFSPREDGGGLERFAVQLGLLLGLGMSLKNGTRGWANIYLGDEDLWGEVYWRYIGPCMLLVLAVIVLLTLALRLLNRTSGDRVPHAFAYILLVLAHQNVIAHAITGPSNNWSEVVFNIYYLLLFFLTAIILYHYHFIQTWVPFLVAAIEADEDEALETAELSGPSSAIGNDLADEPTMESAEPADEEIVEATDSEAPVEESPELTGEDEVVTDEVADDTEATVETPSPEEEFEDAPEADGEAADAAEEAAPEQAEPELEIEADVDDAPEAPIEAIDMADDDEEADLDGTPMFDEDELPTEVTEDENQDGEPKLQG